MKSNQTYKSGKAVLVGRPNTGKSSLLNNLVGQKITIVSPKPQTTQSRITAFFESDRGQIFLQDTPGLFASSLRKRQTKSIISDSLKTADVIIYVIDHSRSWGQEEDETLSLVKNANKPVILVINKTDIASPSFKLQYLEKLNNLPQAIVETSALKGTGIKDVIYTLFNLLPEGKRDETVDETVSPLLSQNSTQFLEELIREKIFLLTKQEVPYQTTVYVTSVINNELRNILKIKGTIEVTEDKYKGMLIGKNGDKITQITNAVRQELELTSGKKVYVTLQVKS